MFVYVQTLAKVNAPRCRVAPPHRMALVSRVSCTFKYENLIYILNLSHMINLMQQTKMKFTQYTHLDEGYLCKKRKIKVATNPYNSDECEYLPHCSTFSYVCFCLKKEVVKATVIDLFIFF